MMDVVNIDTSPTSGDVLKSCAFYQSLCIHTSLYAPITKLLGVYHYFSIFLMVIGGCGFILQDISFKSVNILCAKTQVYLE
jgi:hypothetical protein